MAFIDIPDETQYVNLSTLNVSDFKLATAGNVSNVVVVINVYNTATANTWDYEAYLINNGNVITSNYASNVLHSNITTSEREFIFNANTFSKVVIESQSFGFMYRPRSDGNVRIYVGNVRIRIKNIQPANGITSYITYKSINEDVGVLTNKVSKSSILSRASIKVEVVKTASISALKESVADMLATKESLISTLKKISFDCFSSVQKAISIVSNIHASIQTTKSRFVLILKECGSGIHLRIQKGVSLSQDLVVGIQSILDDIITAITYFLTLQTNLGIKSANVKNTFLDKVTDLKVWISAVKNSYLSLISNTNVGSSVSKFLSKSLETVLGVGGSFFGKLLNIIDVNISSEKRIFFAGRRHYLYLASRMRDKTVKQRENIFKV